MTAASLSLLKGGATALDEELAKPAPAVEAAAEEETVTIEIDNMSSEELDTLVTENAIEVPEWWAEESDAAKKREWLNAQFSPAAEAPETNIISSEELAKGAVSKADPSIGEVPAEVKSPKAKKASKSKAVAKSDVKEGEIVGADKIADMIHEIENLKDQQALDALSAVIDGSDESFFRMGGLLSVIQANKWYEKLGYTSFRDFAEKEHGLEYGRKAVYSIAVYNALAEAKVPWEKVSSIGWTKLKEIAPILTVENVEVWVDKAKSNNTITLIELVREYKKKDKPAALEDQTSKTVTTKTFKVHEDQKKTIEAAIDKAKSSSGTSVDTAALEFICLDYLGGQTMVQKLQKMGIESTLEAVEKAFPNAKIDVEITETEAEAA